MEAIPTNLTMWREDTRAGLESDSHVVKERINKGVGRPIKEK
jgi:hypothetical protein